MNSKPPVEPIDPELRPAARARTPYQWKPGPASWTTLDDGESPIQAVWFSLPSRFFDTADCLALLRGCRKYRPGRRLLVLTDHGTSSDAAGADFRAEAAKLRVELIDPLGREFSPWLRDPFLLVSTAPGEHVAFCRPNVQPGREDDSFAVRFVIENASRDLEHKSGIGGWAQMPMPFHGGHLVHTPDATWISAHSVQERVLELLRRKTLNVAVFQQPGPWQRYTSAVDEAARELAQLCRRAVRFVHPWPVNPTDPDHRAFVETLAGGNGFDLDTLLTILPASATALVGDLTLGGSLVPALSDEELAEFARRFRITRPHGRLRTALRRYQRSAHIRRLNGFLEMTARHLQSAGLRVLRTPLLLIPIRSIARNQKFAAAQPRHHFPMGCSNVVLETTVKEGPCAEGFGSGLATLDRAARAVFAEAGYDLTLHPPLAESLICEGGYRCATLEIRASA